MWLYWGYKRMFVLVCSISILTTIHGFIPTVGANTEYSDSEPNNTFENALIIENNNQYFGSCPNDDEDYYKLILPGKTTLSLTVTLVDFENGTFSDVQGYDKEQWPHSPWNGIWFRLFSIIQTNSASFDNKYDEETVIFIRFYVLVQPCEVLRIEGPSETMFKSLSSRV